MQKGTVVRIMDKGFGFIKTDDSDKDFFFHANSVADDSGIVFNDLQEGDAVTFDMEEGPKGPQAVNVRRAEA